MPSKARRSATLIKMTRGFVILAACLAVTLAVPVEDRAVQSVKEGINQFASAFYKEVSGKQHGNLVTSPLSASIALSMVGYGARTETEEEFKRVLHFPEESVARTGYANLIDFLNVVRKIELHIANKIFINENFSVKPTFQELTENAFRSASQKISFANNQQAAKTINEWVEQQTKNRIRELIKADKLSAETAMVLVNAIYFKAKWLHKFNKAQTKDKTFHLTKSQDKNVATMYRQGTYRHGVLPEMKARFVEIPYEGGEASMIIILPDEIDGLAQVEEKLAQKDLTRLVKTGRSGLVTLHLPKFKIENTLDLNSHLKSMGLKKAFDEFNADFAGISKRGVFISSVVQKTFIEVLEGGTEAAGATAISVMPIMGTIDTDPVRPVEFKVDRPFYYSIVLKESGKADAPLTPLFEGHVISPHL